jgi:hypothetical protein
MSCGLSASNLHGLKMAAMSEDDYEIWRDVVDDVDFTGYYQISNTEIVRSLPRVIAVSGQVPRKLRGRILRPAVRASDGRRQYFLCKDGVMYARTGEQMMRAVGFKQ